MTNTFLCLHTFGNVVGGSGEVALTHVCVGSGMCCVAATALAKLQAASGPFSRFYLELLRSFYKRGAGGGTITNDVFRH